MRHRALRALLGLCRLCIACGAVAQLGPNHGHQPGPGPGPGSGSGAAPKDSGADSVLNPEANTFLGAVVGLRARGAGLFGCGPLTQAGAASIESLRILVDAVNSKQPGSPVIANGISLGVRALDHCGRTRVAVSQLAQLLPELGRDGHDDVSGLPRTLGILDGAGLTRTDSDVDAEVRQALAEAMVPVAPLDAEHLVPPRLRAQALVAAVRRLAWRRFVLVRGSDTYSEELWQALGQLAGPGGPGGAGELCVRSVHVFPAQQDAVTDALADAAGMALPVVVLLPRAALRPFLQALRDARDDAASAASAPPPLLLSDLVAHEDAALLPAGATVYSLSTAREGIPPMQEAVDSLGAALQADAFLSAAQPLLLFTLALRHSWRAKCPSGEAPGPPCAAWTGMSRPEFLNAYFAPLAAAMARGERLAEPGWDARWTRLLQPPQRLSLYRHLQERQHVAEVLSLGINSSVSAVVAVDNAFHPEEVGECGLECAQTCVPLQQKHTRSGAARRIQDNHLLDSEPEDPEDPEEAEGEDFQRLLESPQNLYLALFASVRSAGGRDSTALDCPAPAAGDGAGLDLAGVRRVEAFRWAVQRVNQQLERDGLPLQLGALLADTCASDLRAMALAARLGQQLRGSPPVRRILGGAGSGERVLAVINALPWHTGKMASDILSGSNITTISATQAVGATNSSEPYQLQVDLPVSTMVEAVVQALQQLGWSYVSVVHSDPSVTVFLEAAARAGICVGLEVSLPSDEEVVPRLLGARAGGARGVVVWADAVSTRGLFKAVGRAIALGTLRREDLFWMLASPQGDARDVLQEFGNVLGGASVFSPQRRGVAEFQHYLQHDTRSGKREHRLMGLYHQQCDRQPCEAGAVVQAGDWAVVQSVLSVGAALAGLLRAGEDCPDLRDQRHWLQGGPVCLNSSQVTLDEAVLRSVLASVSPRADGPVGAEFRYSPAGAGVIAVDVDNFRRRAGIRSRSLGEVHFQRVATFSDGTLGALDDLVAYRDSGDEVRVNTLTSQCGGAHASCYRCRLVRGRPNSALGDWIVVDPGKEEQSALYLLAALDIHEPSSNPLQCSQEVSPRGVEQLEAFLWAVDQVNSNHSGPRVGAIAVDSCGSAVRAGKLVAEALWEREAERPVVAVLAGGPVAVVGPVLETAGALGLPVLAPSARGPPADRKAHPPYPLQLAPGSRAIAATLITHLRAMHTDNIAVLYLQDAVDYEETFRQLEALASAANVSLQGLPMAAPVSVQPPQSARQVLLRVRQSQSRVLVLLLPPTAVDLVLRSAAVLEDEGLWPREDGVTWVSLGAEEAMLTHTRHTLGGLVLRTRAVAVEEFQRSFRSLGLDSNRRNPWFPEFWSAVFHCRGRSCTSGPHRDLHTYQMKQSADNANMINAVLAAWHALRSVHREVCPTEPCRAMSELPRVRSRLLELTPRMVFVGAGLNSVSFTTSGENANAAVEVVRVQMSSNSNSAVFVPVPEPSDAGLTPHLLSAPAAPAPPAPADPAAPEEERHTMELQPDSPGLLVLLAAHTATSPFQCGNLSADALCQLASAMFAVHRVNANTSQAPRMGLVAVDTCGQAARAYSSVFSRLSEAESSQRALPVAALVLDKEAVPTVQPLLDMQAIIRLPAQRHQAVEANLEGLSRALLDVSEAVPEASGALVVLHGTSPRARSLARQLESASLSRCTAPGHSRGCLTAVLPLPSSAANSRSGPLYLLSTQPAGSVVILALDSPEDTRFVLLAAQSPAVPRLVFLATPESQNAAAPLRADGHSVLSVVPDASVVPDSRSLRGASSLDSAFQEWLGGLLEPAMPPSWAAAIRNAHCMLDHSTDVVSAVEEVAQGLRWASSTQQAAANLSASVSQYLLNATDVPHVVSTFRLWRGDDALGSWSPEGGLSLSTDPSLLALEESRVPASGRPAVFHNLQHAWAVSLGVIALLGILLTLLTAVFFLSAAAVSKTPMSGGSGTSVLGYLILLGLLLVHCAALSRVLAPAEPTCGLRRVLPASAYAIIFAAMFLKVLTTWQGSGVRPLVLVARALCLAAPQLLISGGWLALVPPSVHLAPPAVPGEPPLWQCYSVAGDGDAHLLLSLAYTCLLMVGTAVLALLCSSKGEEGSMLRQESRSILVASVAVAVQLALWGLAVVVALVPAAQRDVLAASVHVLAATTLLTCLFLPKLRLYLRLRREARSTAAIAATRARSQPIYGISHFQPFGGKLNPAFDAPSMDISLGESASQTGSGSESGTEGGYKDPTQAVPSSLYSMDMFSSQDSGSHGHGVSDMVMPAPVVVAMTTGDGRGTVRGSSILHGTLKGTLRGPVGGGTLRGTLRAAGGTLGGTLRGSHFLPGTNEFTAPHRTSSMLLLPGQESISYM